MKGDAYKLANLRKVFQSIDKAEKNIQDVVAGVVEATAVYVEEKAVGFARFDNGDLRQSINSQKGEDRFTAYVGSDLKIAPYAPYHEFGTGDLVKVPKGLEDIAIQFKGKGIRKVNISPQPFLYPALVMGRKYMTEQFLLEYDKIVKK